MSLVWEEEEEEKEEILSLVRSQTNQEVKSVVFLFLREKVVIFLVVTLVTSQLQCLTHNLQVCLLSYTKSFYPNFCSSYMYCVVLLLYVLQYVGIGQITLMPTVTHLLLKS